MLESTRRGKKQKKLNFYLKTNKKSFYFILQTDSPDWYARIKNLMDLAPLAYSLVIMHKDKIFGVRDPYGNRPLCIGKIVPVNVGKRKFCFCLYIFLIRNFL